MDNHVQLRVYDREFSRGGDAGESQFGERIRDQFFVMYITPWYWAFQQAVANKRKRKFSVS